MCLWLCKGFATKIKRLHISLSRFNHICWKCKSIWSSFFVSHPLCYGHNTRASRQSYLIRFNSWFYFIFMLDAYFQQKYCIITIFLCHFSNHFHLDSHFDSLANRKWHCTLHMCFIITMKISISFMFVSWVRRELPSHYMTINAYLMEPSSIRR